MKLSSVVLSYMATQSIGVLVQRDIFSDLLAPWVSPITTGTNTQTYTGLLGDWLNPVTNGAAATPATTSSSSSTASSSSSSSPVDLFATTSASPELTATLSSVLASVTSTSSQKGGLAEFWLSFNEKASDSTTVTPSSSSDDFDIPQSSDDVISSEFPSNLLAYLSKTVSSEESSSTSATNSTSAHGFVPSNLLDFFNSQTVTVNTPSTTRQTSTTQSVSSSSQTVAGESTSTGGATKVYGSLLSVVALFVLSSF